MITNPTLLKVAQWIPMLAISGLILITLSGIIAIVIIRLYTEDVPAGLIAVTSSAVTALVMTAGKRRL